MAAHSKNFVILACTILIQCQGVTDGRTDRQTDRQTRQTDEQTPSPWLRRMKHSIARKKQNSRGQQRSITALCLYGGAHLFQGAEPAASDGSVTLVVGGYHSLP